MTVACDSKMEVVSGYCGIVDDRSYCGDSLFGYPGADSLREGRSVGEGNELKRNVCSSAGHEVGAP